MASTCEQKTNYGRHCLKYDRCQAYCTKASVVEGWLKDLHNINYKNMVLSDTMMVSPRDFTMYWVVTNIIGFRSEDKQYHWTQKKKVLQRIISDPGVILSIRIDFNAPQRILPDTKVRVTIEDFAQSWPAEGWYVDDVSHVSRIVLQTSS